MNIKPLLDYQETDKKLYDLENELLYTEKELVKPQQLLNKKFEVAEADKEMVFK